MPAILDGMTPQQRAAATATGPVLVIAGAGTGKTKTLIAAVAHRIAACFVPASRILAVTFTNKAAAEMSRRIRDALGEAAAPGWIGTFHGLGARQLRIEPELAGLRANFDILDADDSRRATRRVMKTMNLPGADQDESALGESLRLVASRIGKWKDELVTPEEAPSAAEAMITEANRRRAPIDPASLRAAARVYAEYQRTLRDANAADFGDLLLWPVRAMMRDRACRQRWAGRFQCVLADQYQDVNRAQYFWIRLLAEDHKEILCVGDDDQAIFGWRGADIRFIRRFTRDYPGAQQFRLEQNFRSTPHILEAANALIALDRNRLGKTLFTRKPHGAPIEILRFRNEEAEANAIVTEIVRRRAERVAWDEIAILYRSNAITRPIEEALVQAGVPYTLIGDVGFYQRAEIKDALALLKLTTSPEHRQNDDAFVRVINAPPRGLGQKALTILREEAGWRQVSLLQAIETAPLPRKARAAALAFADAICGVRKAACATVADQLSLALDASGYRQMLRESRAETAAGRLENVQELIGLTGKFHSARELLDHVALASGGPNEDAAGTVRLLTLHKAKGLEFGHVFLPAWEQGLFPPTYGDPEEERRLAYVALTRGMERITISYCRFRKGPSSPSPFIADIPEENKVLGWLTPRSRMPVAARMPGRHESAAAGFT